MNRPATGVVLSIMFAVAAVGCSRSDRPPLGRVSGIVTIDGAPLAGAIVIFEPQGVPASTGMTDESGHYELTYLRDIPGAAVGQHTVRIATVADGASADGMPGLHDRASGLQREVKPGRNVFDFHLER